MTTTQNKGMRPLFQSKLSLIDMSRVVALDWSTEALQWVSDEILVEYRDAPMILDQDLGLLLAVVATHPKWRAINKLPIVKFKSERRNKGLGLVYVCRDGTGDRIGKKWYGYTPERQHVARVKDMMRMQAMWTVEQAPPGYDRHHSGNTLIELIEEFLKMSNITYKDIELVGEGQCKDFRNIDLKLKWLDYHHRHANLILLTKDQHRKAHKND